MKKPLTTLLTILFLTLSSSLLTICRAQYNILLNFNGANGSSPDGSLIEYSHKLYGMTTCGGVYNGGVVFSMDSNGLNDKNLHSFFNDTINGAGPWGNLTRVGNKFYGMTKLGGAHVTGNIFSIDTNGLNYKNLWSFEGMPGSGPWGSLIYLRGRLYGMTGPGTIFSIDTNGSGYKDMFDFSGPNGSGSYASLLLSGNKFYGMTQSGGSANDGVIFSIDTNGAGFKLLLDFAATTGQRPYGSLIIAGGTLYGLTAGGGAKGDGIIFSIDTNGNNYRDRFDFNGTNGYGPWGSLAYSSGVLYGMATGEIGGYGNIFAIDTSGNNFRDLFVFNNINGCAGFGDVTIIGGKLYGTTEQGGANYKGVMFSIDTNGSNYKVMYSFGSLNQGASPYGSLIFSGGLLYGMTSNGGVYKCGTIVSIDTSGSNYNKLYDFDKPTSDGQNPQGSLIAFHGKLYGMTSYGGINGFGNIFSMDTNGNNYWDLWDFMDTGVNGARPWGSLIMSGGKLYGMTSVGGLKHDGNIFSIDTNGDGYKNLWNFDVTANTNGSNPYGSLILVGYKLFGMTEGGGGNGYGLIFSIDTNGTGYEDLWDFDPRDTNGSQPYGDLLYNAGHLYGMTVWGGLHDKGSIFSIDTNGSRYRDLFDFTGANGGDALGSLIISGHTLFGMTRLGGIGRSYYGNIFSIDTNGTGYASLLDFDGAGGGSPDGSLLLSGNNLYGMASYGGDYEDGVVFRIDTAYRATEVNNIAPAIEAVNLFPNPNNGVFQLGISNYELGESTTVEIYNVLSEKVYSSYIPQTPKGALINIDVSENRAGIYLYRVISETGGLVGEGKFIIQK